MAALAASAPLSTSTYLSVVPRAFHSSSISHAEISPMDAYKRVIHSDGVDSVRQQVVLVENAITPYRWEQYSGDYPWYQHAMNKRTNSRM